MSVYYRLTDVYWKLVLLSQDIVGPQLSSDMVDFGTFDRFRRTFFDFAYFDKSNGEPYMTYNGYENFGNLYAVSEDLSDGLTPYTRRVYFRPNYSSQYMYGYTANPVRISTNNSSVLVPNLVVPFRIYGTEAANTIQGDLHWRTLFMGGDWNGNMLPQLFDRERVYYDASTIIAYPCSEEHEKALEYRNKEGAYSNYRIKATATCNYPDYNQYAAQYQEWAHSVPELCIPNVNLVAKYLVSAENLGQQSFTTRARARDEQLAWTESESKTLAYFFPVGWYWKRLEKDQYFGTYFPQTQQNREFKDVAMESQQNIFFTNAYFRYLYYNGGFNSNLTKALESQGKPVEEKLSTFYNIEIKFNRHGNMKTDLSAHPTPEMTSITTTSPPPAPEETKLIKISKNDNAMASLNTENTFRYLIGDNGFDGTLLEILKDLDEGNYPEINRKRLPFSYAITKGRSPISPTTGIPSSTEVKDVETTGPANPIAITSTNYLELLLYVRNNGAQALNNNYIFMNPYEQSYNTDQVATQRDDNISRMLKGESISKVMAGTIEALEKYFSALMPAETAYTNKSVSDAYHRLGTNRIIDQLHGPNLHYNEVLAYKIEKMGGTPTGDENNQQVIQKFWFFNSPFAGQEISLLDSQVKYGQNYTYKITAYTLVLSHKYKYGDLRLTKQIGSGDYLSAFGGTGAWSKEFCLQFYDPFNNDETASQLLTTPDGDRKSTVANIAEFNSIAPSSVELSMFPYLADFNLYIEPCLELLEVPIFEKTLKVMDYPPNPCNVTPFHFTDSSNRIGFQITQDSFIKRPYPELLTLEDKKMKDDFLNSKALQNFNLIDKFSESPARFIEMYRTKTKPNDFMDFKDSLVATIDLRIENSDHNYGDKILADKINTNTKYYYIFRFLNEHKMPGPVSQIIEAELVNDGGYTYAIFDTVSSSEFNPNIETIKSINFKKLLQLKPVMNQLRMYTDRVDYNDYAINQISNISVGIGRDNLFKTKFKIRLTSKKTGKKIDLNVKYNLLERNISKPSNIYPPYDNIISTDPATNVGLDEHRVFVETDRITLEPEDISPVRYNWSSADAHVTDDTDIVDIDNDTSRGY